MFVFFDFEKNLPWPLSSLVWLEDCRRFADIYQQVGFYIEGKNRCLINAWRSCIDREVDSGAWRVQDVDSLIGLACTQARKLLPKLLKNTGLPGDSGCGAGAVCSVACNLLRIMVPLRSYGCSCGCNGSIYQI